MTIHVNIAEAKARLSELVAASLRGEEVVLQKAGVPQARIVAVDEARLRSREEIGARRLAAFEDGRRKYAHLHGTGALTVPPSMTDEELEERFQRKFGPAAD